MQAMLDQNRRLEAVRADDEHNRIDRQIASIDGEIKGLVDELLSLSKEEIEIVDGN